MSIYDISYDQKAVELLPPDKRTAKQVSWVKAMFGQLKYLRDAIFTYYKGGITSYNSYYVNKWEPLANGGLGYFQNEPVKYGEAVYVSLDDGNLSVPPSIEWALVQNNFIGVDERIMFNANKLVFEYALNKRFDGQFYQPPNVSQIYIVKNSLPNFPFIVGGDENSSSSVFQTYGGEVIIDSYSLANFNNFTIMVKDSVYYAIDPSGDPAIIDKIIRNFADRYNTISLNYDIQTY